MAHRGKAWPLTFRRDVLLNARTYRFGFAEQYFFTPLGLQGTLGLLLNGHRFRCKDAVETFNAVLTWTSSPETIGGIQIVCKVIEEVLAVPQDNFMRYEIWGTSLGLLYARQYFAAAHPISEGGFMPMFAHTTHSTPGVIFDTGVSTGTLAPVQYGL